MNTGVNLIRIRIKINSILTLLLIKVIKKISIKEIFKMSIKLMIKMSLKFHNQTKITLNKIFLKLLKFQDFKSIIKKYSK